jgi:hypothetical protein
MYDPSERGKILGIYYVAPLLGPSLGPILGGTLTQVFGWRANFWLLTAFLGVDLVAFMGFFRETFRRERSVTYRRAAARRNGTMIPRPSSSKGSNVDSKRVSGVLGTASKEEILGDVPNLVSSDGGATWDDIQERITPSLADINPFPPLILVLRRWNNVPTLISSGMTHYPRTLRLPTYLFAHQVCSLPLASRFRTPAPEHSPSRTTTTRSKPDYSSSPSAPGTYWAACLAGDGPIMSCVGKLAQAVGIIHQRCDLYKPSAPPKTSAFPQKD